MKKIIVTTVLSIMMVVCVTAQQERQRLSVEDQAKNQTERLEKLLNLNASQKTKIQALNLDFAKKSSEARTALREDREAMRAKMLEIDKERDKKYKEIFTAEQFKKYTEDKAEREKQMQERRGQRQS